MCLLMHVNIWTSVPDPSTSGILSPPSFLGHPVTVYSPSKHNSTVAACLLVKNETRYIDEWMDFHIALGFAPIYIYDNSISDDMGLHLWHRKRKDIQKYVKLIHFPQAPAQVEAYQQCLESDAANHTFAALIDIDEFVILKKHDNIVDFMEDHCDENCGQISLNWKMMSLSDNGTKYRPIPTLKRVTHSSGIWGTIKVIVRPSYVDFNHFDWHHSVPLKRGNWVDTSGKVIKRPNNWRKQANDDMPQDVALLYHYRFRSEQEFYYKNCVRGDVLQPRGITPLCNKKGADQGMFGGQLETLAWEKLMKMVPKYAIFENNTNATINRLYPYFPYAF